MTLDYETFVAQKLTRVPATGLVTVPELHPRLFGFQRDICTWALKRGRCTAFLDTGLGKTGIELVWADAVARYTGKPVLILAPLAVGAQTLREAGVLGWDIGQEGWAGGGPCVRQVKYDGDGPAVGAHIEITNYDRLHHFDPARFSGVVLDESSIIKNSDSKTLARLIESFAQTPFKLCASATPSPNDYTELGSHAEFLGVCTKEEMLAEYFCHDGGETQKWRLKGHARKAFWRWVSTWGALLRKPSDLGYDDSLYELPPLRMHHHTIAADPEETKAAGLLFAEPANTLTERRLARKNSLGERCAAAADLVASLPAQPILAWCHLNAEGDLLEKSIPGAVQVAGKDTEAWKETCIRWFQGQECICQRREFSAKLASWRPNADPDTRKSSTESIEPSGSPSQSHGQKPTQNGVEPTSQNTLESIQKSISGQESNRTFSTQRRERDTRPIRNIEQSVLRTPLDGQKLTRASDSLSESESLELPSTITSGCSASNAEVVPFAEADSGQRTDQDFTSITIMSPAKSGVSYASSATTESERSTTSLDNSSEPRCICGHRSGKRILISKEVMFGFGLNLQICSKMIFVGPSDSYEKTYQAIRRCWRFGQKLPVDVWIFASELEGNVVANFLRKQEDARKMAEELSAETRDALLEEIRGQTRRTNDYAARQFRMPGWLTRREADLDV